MNDRTITAWRRKAGWLVAGVLAAATTPAPAQVEVVNPTVQAGEATLNITDDVYHVQQQSMNAIIEYDLLNIYSGGSMVVDQISAQAALLNRINSASPTLLDGHIQAPGSVFFVNPAGVIFGPNAVLDVAGIYAAAGKITNEEFMVGSYRFTDLQGSVINYGEISADFVALVGKRVINDGIILSPDGMVAMVAGDEVMIGQQNGNILVKVDKSSDIGPDAGVENNGTIDTGANGQVVLGAGDMYWLGVKQTPTGLVKAGDITVDATGSRAEVSGTLDASNPDGDGGRIRVLADEVALYTAYVDASGATGGGQINIGGSLQGQGPLPNAQSVLVDSGTVLRADAVESGDGGTVILWADNSMTFEGAVYARGAGGLPGSGGFVEVSGIYNWIFRGTVDTGGGWLLLDPVDVTVDGVLAAALVAALGGGNVVLHTVNAVGMDEGDITISNAISWSSAFALAVMAEDDLIANADVINTGTGAVTMVAGWDASTGFSPTDADNNGETGAVTFASIIADPGSYGNSGGNITLGAGVDINSGGAVNMAANAITNSGNAISGDSVTLYTLGAANTGAITTTTGALAIGASQSNSGSTSTIGTLTLGAAGNTITTGTGGDTIILTNTQANLVIDGVSGSDTLRGPNSGTVDWVVDSATTGTIDRDGAATWQNFDILRGRNADDSWTINAAINFTGTIGHSTNGGTNMLTLLAGATLTGTYTGGSGADTIFFNPTSSITGVVDGNGGTDTLNYSAFGATVDVTLTGLGTTDGFDGDVGATISSFADFNAVVGSAMTDDSLTGLNADSAWTIGTGSDDYVSTNTFGFSALEEYFGGSADDDFTVTPGASAYMIDGGTETTSDTLTIDTTPITAPVLTPTTDPTTGTWSFTGGSDVDFTEIESTGVSGPITSFSLVFDSVILGLDDGTDDAWNLALNGAGDTVMLSGAFVFNQALAQVDSVTVTGSADDDTLTVDFTNGNPFGAGGLFFDAGGQDDDGDSLVLDNGSFTTVTHFFDNANDGTVDVDGDLISYTGLEPITDNLDATDRIFTFDTTSDTIIVNGADDGATDNNVSRIDSNNSEIVDFTNPTGSLTVNAGGGDDTVAFEGLDSDTGTPYGGTVALNGDAGDDDVTLGSAAGSLDSLAGITSITVAGGAHTTADSLTLDDSADGTANTYSISATVVTRTSGGITVNYGTLEDLTLSGGTGGNTINVTATAAATPVTVNTGTGTNTVNVSSDAPTNNGNLNAISGALSIIGEGTDTLNLADDSDATADAVTITDAANTTTISGLSPADITYQSGGGADLDVLNLTAGTGGDTITINNVSTTGETTINAGAGDDTVNVNATTNLTNLTVNGDAQAAADTLVGPNMADIWNVTGAGAGTFGTVGTEATFSGFENLTGNAGADTFNIAAAGSVAGTVDGVSGADAISATASAGADALTVDLSANQIGGLPGGTLDYANIDTLTLDGAGNAGDTLDITADAGVNDALVYTPAAVGGTSTMTGFDTSGQPVSTINFTNTESASIDGNGGTDSLAVAAGGAAVTFDNPGTPTVTVAGTVGMAYTDIDSGSLTGAVAGINVDHTAAGGTTTLTTGANAASGSIIPQGGITFTFTGLSAGAAIDIDGGAGDDVLLFTHSGAALLDAVIDFAGAGQTASDLVRLTGAGGVTTQTYTATDADTGSIDLDSTTTVNYDGVEPIFDSMTATNVVIGLTGAADTVSIGNGPGTDAAFSGEDTTLVSAATIEDIEFANKTNVDIHGLDGADVFTLDHAIPSTGLATLDLFGHDDAGAAVSDDDIDTFTVRAIGAGLTNVGIAGEGGSDVASVGSVGDSLDGILSALTVTGDGAGTDTLTLNDQGDGTANTYALSATVVTRNGGVTVNYSTLDTLTVNAGTGGNTISVTATASGTATNVNTGTGANVVNVSSNAPTNTGNVAGIASLLTLTGQGTDTLNLSDVGSATGATVVLDDTTITDSAGFFGAGGSITYSSLETIGITLGTGGDTITVDATDATTTTLGITGSAGDDTFNINGLNGATATTLTGSAGDDDFNIGGGDLSATDAPLTIVASEGGETSGDTVDLDDSARDTGVTYDINTTVADQIDFGGTNPIVVDGTLEHLVVHGTTDTDFGDGDTFDVTPSADYTITVEGNEPIGLPGDTLLLDLTGLGSIPTFTWTSYGISSSGTISGVGMADVSYSEIETFDPDGPMNLVLDIGLLIQGVTLAGNGTADAVDIQTDVATGTFLAPTIDPNGAGDEILMPIPLDSANSMLVIGGDDNDTVNLNEVASPAADLPTFLDEDLTNAHENTAFNNNATFNALDVSLHFQGDAADSDTLVFSFISAQNVGYFSDLVDTLNSGVIAIQGMFAMSFEGLAPITMTGAGGTLTIDASANDNVTAISLYDDAVADDGYNVLNGDHASFEDVTFGGFDTLDVLSGDGADTITVGDDPTTGGAVENIDDDAVGGTALLAVTVSGENTTATDASADTFHVEELPGSITLTVDGGRGDDIINIKNQAGLASGANDLSRIVGLVTVVGGLNSDTLNINDTGDATDNGGTIDDTTISGLHLGSQIDYSGVELANVTLGAGADTITIDGSGASDTASTGLTLDTGAGIDSITVNWSNFATAGRLVRVLAGGDSDTLTINGTTASEVFELRTDGGLEAVLRTSPTAQTVRYSGVDNLIVDASTGINDVISIVDPVGDAGDITESIWLLTSQGTIIDNNATATADLTTAELRLLTDKGIADSTVAIAGTTVDDTDNDILETDVSTLDFYNATSGDVLIANDVGGLLTIANRGNASHGNPGAGTTTITNASPITVDASYTFGGNTTFTASDSGAAGDSFLIHNGAIITIDSGIARTLTINAADDITFSDASNTGRIVTQGGGVHTVNLNADTEGNGDGLVSQHAASGAVSVTTDNLNIVAPEGVGTDTRTLRINVVNLDSDSSGADGDQFILEDDGLSGLTLASGAGNVHLTTTAGGASQTGTDTIDVTGLALTGTGTFDLTAGTNDATTLAASITGPLTYTNASGAGLLTVGTVTDGSASTVGITTSGATSLIADSITVSNTAAGTDLSAAGITLATSAGLDGTVTFDAGSVVNANGGAFSITADEVALNGSADSVRGTSTLLIQPDEATDAMAIGTAGGGADSMDLTDAELLTLQEGFTTITLGRSDGSHAITVNSAVFRDNVVIQTPTGGTITVASDGTFAAGIDTTSIAGGSTNPASITLQGDGDGGAGGVGDPDLVFQINDDLLTTNGTINILLDDANAGVTRFGPDANTVTLDTVGTGSGADITIEGSLSGTGALFGALEYLVANAGTGTATATGGQDSSLTNWQWALVPNFTGDTVYVVGGDVYGNPVYTADDLVFPNEYGGSPLNPVASGGTGTPELNIVFQTLTSTLNIGVGNNDDPTALNIDQADIDDLLDGFSSITIGRNNGTGILRINETGSGVPVMFIDPIFFRMGGATGDVVLFDAAAGAKTGGFFDFPSLTNTEVAADLAMKISDGLIRDIGGETAGDPASFENEAALDASITMKGGTATIDITGRQETDGTGLTYLTPVNLTGDAEFVTTGTIGTGRGTSPAGATIRFADTLNGTTAGTEDVIFIAGTGGDLLFQNFVGNNVRLGHVLVSDDDAGTATEPVNDIIASQNFIAKSFTQDHGTGSSSFLGDLDTRGVNGGPFGGLGDGGVVDIITVGDVTISGTTNTQGGTAAPASVGNPGGDVDIIAANITVGPINTSGSGATAGAGGNAGNVTLDVGDPDDAAGTNAGGQITLGTSAGGDISTVGGSGSGGAQGDGGDVTIGDDEEDTTEDDIALNRPLVTITTTGLTDGNVHFDGATDGNNNALTLVMDTGSFDTEDTGDTFQNVSTFTVSSGTDVTFNATVGGTDPLDTNTDGFIDGVANVGNIDVTLLGNLTFERGGALTGQLRVRTAVDVLVDNDQPFKAGSILQDTGTGLTQFTGTVETTAAGGIDITNDSITFGDGVVGADGTDGVTVRNAGSVDLTIDGVADDGTGTLIIHDGAPFNLIGGGSFTQNGAGVTLSEVQVGDNITTSGGGITFRDDVEATENIILTTGDTVGGNILFDQDLYAEVDGTESVTLTAGSGNISVNGNVGTMTVAGDRELSKLLIDDVGDDDAGGAADVTFAGTVHVLDFIQETGSGETEFQGNVIVTQNFIDADVLDSTDAVTTLDARTGFFVRTSGNLFFNGSDLAVMDTGGATGGSNIVLQVGNADFTGGDKSIGIEKSGGGPVGVLVIEPFGTGGNLNAGTGSGGIALSNSDVNALAGRPGPGEDNHDSQAGTYGFVRIFLGASDGTGSISVNNGVLFHSPLYVRSPGAAGDITIGTGGIELDGPTHEIVFDAPLIFLGGTVTTSAGNIYFVSGASRDNTGDFIPDPTQWLGDNVNALADALDGLANVQLTGNSTVDSTGGHIYFENRIDGDGNPADFDLTLDAGGAPDGNIWVGAFDDGRDASPTNDVTGLVGSVDRVGDILIVDADDVTFGGAGLTKNSSGTAVFLDASLAGTGSIIATSFTQAAGSGNTTLNGTTPFGGVNSSLRTGGFDNEHGGLVQITLDGDFFAAGAIITRGGTRTPTSGVGYNGESVLIDAATIEVHRIDARGAAANSSGLGGNAGAIDLDAALVTLHGDLLATGGTSGTGGSVGHGDAGDVTLASDPLTHAIIIDPVNTGGQTIEADTVVIQGNDVVFDATVDAAAAGADSLYVDTFADFTQVPRWGLTLFNARVGDGAALRRLRTDTNLDLKIADVALAPRTGILLNTDSVLNRLVGGFTVFDTDVATVSDEMTFNDGVIIAFETGVTTFTATDVTGPDFGTIRFNNTLGSATGENNDLTLVAPATIFDDNGTVGQDFNNAASDGIDAQVGPTTDAFDVSLGSVPNPLDDTLNPLGILITTDNGVDTTYINTAFMGMSDVQFNDPVEVAAASSTVHATGTDAVVAIGSKTIVFEDTINSSAGEFNILRLVTSNGGTTRFNGIIGGTRALARLQTDLTGDADTDTGVSDGVTEINTTTINLSGASAQFNDPVVLFMDLHITEAGVGDVVFNEIVDSDATGPFDLWVTTVGGSTIFRSEVGTNPGAGFTHIEDLLTDGGGTTEIHADMIAVTVNIDDPALIGIDQNIDDVPGAPDDTNTVGQDSFGVDVDGLVTIGELGTTTEVIFHSTVDSIPGENSDLTIISTVTQFMEDVGSTDPLGTVITTDGLGPDTTILGDNSDGDSAETVTFEADQFIFDDAVVLEDHVRITGNQDGDGTDDSSMPNLAIAFNNTVDSDAPGTPRDLTVITTDGGLTLFGNGVGTDDVGLAAALGILTVDLYSAGPIAGDGFTLINSATVTVVSEATFNDKVAIGRDGVMITATDVAGPPFGTIRFNNTLDAESTDAANTNDLTLVATTTIFDDDGGSGQDLDDGVTTANDAVDGIVGGANPLGTLRTTSGGASDTTVVNTTQMTANVLQFDDRVIVATDLTTFASGANPGSGAAVFTGNRDDTPDGNPAYDHTNDAIQFNNHLDSASGENNEIYLNTPNGGTTLIGNEDTDTVGTAAAFRPGRLVTDAPGQTHIEAASINTEGASVIYNDPVVLFSDVVISEFGTGFVYFNSTVNSDALGTPRDLTVFTDGGLTRFGDADGTNDDSVGAVFPLDVLTLTDFDGIDGVMDITQINADIYADVMLFNDDVEIGSDGVTNGVTFGPGDAVIVLAADDTPGDSPNTSVTFNGMVNSAPSLTHPILLTPVTDLASNLVVDSATATFGNLDTDDEVGTRIDDGAGTDGALGLLYLRGTPGVGNNLTRLNTDRFLAYQFYFDSDARIDYDLGAVHITGLADGSAASAIEANPFVTGLTDGDDAPNVVGDAMVFNGTISSQTDEFNDLNLDTVNGGDVWINGRVGTTDTTTAAATLAQPAVVGDLEGEELGTFQTDNPANPLVDSGHFLVDVPPHDPAPPDDVADDLVPNGVTHINTDVVKAGGEEEDDTINFYDPVVIDTDGVYISDFGSGIFFHNTLDSAADEENDVNFYAPGFFDDGDITFFDVVGDSDGDDDTTNTRLGDVIVYSVDDLTAMALFKVTSYTQEADGIVGGPTGSGRGDTIFEGLVDTSGVTGGPDPDSPDGGDIYIINENIPANGPLSRTIEFRMGANLDGAGAGDDAGNFMIRPDAGSGDLLSHAGGLAPRTWIVLGGDFSLLGGAGGMNGNFELSPDGFEDIPTVATYTGYLTFLGVGGGVPVSITTGTFFTGRAADPATPFHPGKGTFYDTLLIDARGTPVDEINPDNAAYAMADPVLGDAFNFIGGPTVLISVMDIASVDDMTFIVPGGFDIEIALRLAFTVLDINGVQTPDLGVDIVVGGFTDWSVTPIFRPGTVGNPPTFSNPGATGNVSSTLEFFPYRDYGLPIDELSYLFGGVRLDPSSEGPSNVNAAEALAGALPKPEQSGVILRETIVGDVQRQLLAEFAGVDLAGLTPAQRLEFLTGRELYADLPDSLAVQAVIARALLTESRLLYEPVSNMLTFYRRVFLEEVVNPETGQVELVSRHVENRRALASALGEYSGQYGEFNAQQFLTFIQGSETHADALHTIRSLKTLSRKFELMGLAPREVGEAMLGVAELVVPEGMTVDQLVQVIDLAQPLDDESAALEPEPGTQVPGGEQ